MTVPFRISALGAVLVLEADSSLCSQARNPTLSAAPKGPVCPQDRASAKINIALTWREPVSGIEPLTCRLQVSGKAQIGVRGRECTACTGPPRSAFVGRLGCTPAAREVRPHRTIKAASLWQSQPGVARGSHAELSSEHLIQRNPGSLESATGVTGLTSQSLGLCETACRIDIISDIDGDDAPAAHSLALSWTLVNDDSLRRRGVII